MCLVEIESDLGLGDLRLNVMDNSLLASIQAGKKLKAVKSADSNSSSISTSAPKPPRSSATAGPPAPPLNNRATPASNAGMVPPNLGGLFAGGMPTLKKSSGGVRLSEAAVSSPSHSGKTILPRYHTCDIVSVGRAFV